MEDPLGYYAALNVSPGASDAEIMEHYDRLSGSHQARSHPSYDRAKEVLLDPVKRFAYDQYGGVGVSLLESRSHNFALSKTDEDADKQLNSKINRLLKTTRKEQLKGQLNPRTEAVLELSCAQAFDDAGALEVKWTSTKVQEVLRFEMSQSVGVDLGFVVFSRGRMGLGAVCPRLYWRIDPSVTAQLGLQVGDLQSASMSLEKRIDRNT
jgi:hypothetical protein